MVWSCPSQASRIAKVVVSVQTVKRYARDRRLLPARPVPPFRRYSSKLTTTHSHERYSWLWRWRNNLHVTTTATTSLAHQEPSPRYQDSQLSWTPRKFEGEIVEFCGVWGLSVRMSAPLSGSSTLILAALRLPYSTQTILNPWRKYSWRGRVEPTFAWC